MTQAIRIWGKPLRYLQHPVAVLLATLLYFALIRYFDTRWRFLPYTMAATFLLAAVFFLASRRPVFSFYGAATLSILLTLASMVKFELKGISLHVYDLIFTGGDSSVLSFLMTYYTSVVVSAFAALLATTAFLMLMFVLEKPSPWRISRRLLVVAFFIPVVFVAYQPTKRDADFLPFVGGYNASAFFLSLWHLPNLVKPNPLGQKLVNLDAGPAFADIVNCGTGRKSDFFLVLSESQASPTLFPGMWIPEWNVDTFRSGDGRTRPLFVEIFGGGTWMTSFSVLTGLSTADLGWQGPYVNQLLEGKVRGALPELLARCGYRTVAIMPMRYHAVNEGPFLKSIGFQEVFDSAAVGVDVMEVRDKAYFDYAEQVIARHRAEDDRPLFLMVQSMFTHSPYVKSLLGDDPIGKHVYSADPQENEYMRRVAAARADIKAFIDRRRAEPGKNGSLFAEYGDHQSVATRARTLAQSVGDNPSADFRSKLYETFYSVHGFGMDVDFSRLDQEEDAAFLAARLLQAGGLPTSPLFTDLLRLSDLCKGRFNRCEQRAEVDAHLKRRMDAGLFVLD